jgi:cytochrome b6-f complex iron-sulfur subunit
MIPLLRTLVGVVFGSLLARLATTLSRFQGGHTLESKKIARRGFLRNATLGAVVVILAQFGAGLIRFWWPNKTGAFGKELTVAASNIPPVNGTPFTVPAGKFYLVHTPDGLMALYWKCVHLGCTVPWVPAENQFHCPCHGSIYNYEGVRTGGPAPRPLDYMAVRIDSATGDVIVDTGDIRTRSAYDPSQATPV